MQFATITVALMLSFLAMTTTASVTKKTNRRSFVNQLVTCRELYDMFTPRSGYYGCAVRAAESHANYGIEKDHCIENFATPACAAARNCVNEYTAFPVDVDKAVDCLNEKCPTRWR